MANGAWPKKVTFMSDPALVTDEFDTSALKETKAFSLQDLNKAVNDQTFGRTLIHRVAINQKQYDMHLISETT